MVRKHGSRGCRRKLGDHVLNQKHKEEGENWSEARLLIHKSCPTNVLLPAQP